MMNLPESEVFPLNNGKPYGVYDDNYEYTPVDEESRKIVQRRRWMKYGSVTAIVGAAAVLAVIAAPNTASSSIASSKNLAVEADHIFAGLLADENAFYFPTQRQEQGDNTAHRFLRALTASTVDWAYDWNANAKDGAAIGEYYHAKGMAMADYYRSKFDPTYTKAAAGDAADADAKDADSASAVDTAPWTYDWKADMDRGIAVGQHYKAIGDAINAHYREAFDPTYPGSAGGGRRALKSKDKKKKELYMDMAARDNAADGSAVTAGAAGWYDWQADRDRGMAIGQHFKEMGEEIADHYNQEFNPMYDVNKKAYAGDQNWATVWQDYKKRGDEIADYYKAKGAAINKYYAGKYEMEGMSSPVAHQQEQETNDGHATVNDVTTGNVKNADAAYIWGVDPLKDRQHAMEIHQDMMNKGLAIGEYYRAKYDPTYAASSGGAPPAAAKTELLGSSKDAAEEAASTPAAASAHNPDLDYPPWGQNPAADRDHGMALGQYWKNQGIAMGSLYNIRGMELGTYYEDKYRSQFDPTYNGGKN